MQEEISLREILETIWNGKMVIVAITIIAVIISGIVSFFVIAPTYEATSTVRVVSNTEANNTNEVLNSFAESIQSDVSINRIIEKLNLNRTEYSIKALRKSIQVTPIEGTNIIRINVNGEDSEVITNIANLLVFELGARIEISDRSVEIVQSRSRILELDDTISISQSELTEAQEQLENTPEKLVTRQSLADEPYLQSVVEQSSDVSSREAGALSLTSENINPLYTSLKSRISDVTINLSKATEEKKINEKSVVRNESIINQLEVQIDNDRLRAINSARLLNGLNAVFINPAFEPSEPISPNKVLNVAIAFVVGMMLSLMTVFVRQYWHDSSTPAESSGKEISM